MLKCYFGISTFIQPMEQQQSQLPLKLQLHKLEGRLRKSHIEILNYIMATATARQP